MRSILAAELVLATVLGAPAALAQPTTSSTDGRLSVGAGPAVDPLFAVGLAELAWFPRPTWGVGLRAAHSVAGVGDRRAVERGFGFLDLVARWRPPTSSRWSADLLGGGGLARVSFGTPGAHTELAPDVLVGAAVNLALGRRWELAGETSSHVAFTRRAATRNPPHTSTLIALLVRVRLGR